MKVETVLRQMTITGQSLFGFVSFRDSVAGVGIHSRASVHFPYSLAYFHIRQ